MISSPTIPLNFTTLNQGPALPHPISSLPNYLHFVHNCFVVPHRTICYNFNKKMCLHTPRERSGTMGFKSIREQQEEIYREEQTINFIILIIPWIYVTAMVLLHFAMERHGQQLYGDVHIFPGFVRTRYHSFVHGTTNDLGMIGFLVNPSFGFFMFLAYGLMMPVPRGIGSSRGEEDWNIVEDWHFSGSKILSLIAAVICAVLLFLFSDSSFCGNTVSRKYCFVFMGIASATSFLLFLLIRWALYQKVNEQVNLSLGFQTALRALEIGSIILILLICTCFYLFPA